jgi:hypothetical protein
MNKPRNYLKSVIYFRHELPNEEEHGKVAVSLLKEIVEDEGWECIKVFVDSFSEEMSNPAYENMLSFLGKNKGFVVQVDSFHHFTKGALLQVSNKIDEIIQMDHLVRMQDSPLISKENWNLIKSTFVLSAYLNDRIKKEKINIGISKKRHESPDGKIHKGRVKGGDYRRKDKDESVAKLREEGYTIAQIAEKEEISIGRVRNILNSLREEGAVL